MNKVVYCFLLLIKTNLASLEEDNALLPRLFHVDDQDRCLLQKDGVYCLGEFDLSPLGVSPMYDKIEQYSSQPLTFNRSRLHRGYCLSHRCRQVLKLNISTREQFERCVQRYARPHALSVRLRSLQYCSTHRQHQLKMSQGPDAEQQLFLQLVGAVLALNFAGTVYDLWTDDSHRNSALSSWSIRSNWRRLVDVYDSGEPRVKQLEPINGMRVVSMLFVIFCHMWIQEFQFFVTSPQNLEALFKRFDGVIMVNGMSLVQGFLMISSFLTSYMMLINSEKKQIHFAELPMMVIKRLIRLAPVHIFLVGFTATYWSSMRTGVGSAVIEQLSAKCRRKFWYHVFFLNNIVDKEDMCLPPTWFLAADMHLYILSCAFSIIMVRNRHVALRLYAGLFVLSGTLCGVVAYVAGYKVISAVADLDVIRGLFLNTPSFSEYYMSSWSALPACFAGLFLGHLQYELQQKKYDWSQNRWIIRLRSWLIPAVLLYSYLFGVTLASYKERWVTALCVALDRPIFVSILACLVVSVINYEGGLTKFFAWSGWRVPARLSLPVMMMNWLVTMVVAARSVTYYASFFDTSVDFLGSLFYTYSISLLISLMIEIPVQRFFAQIFN